MWCFTFATKSRGVFANRGLTLLEMIVVISIVGILSAIALPSFQHVTRSSQLAAASNDLVSALNLARNEAITRVDRVTICRSSDGQACNTGPGFWEEGWIVFHDSLVNGSPGVVNDPADLIRVYPAAPAGVTLRTGSNIANYLSYREQGQVRGHNGALGNGTFRACDQRGTSAAIAIVLNNTGRIRTTRVTSVCP